MLFYDNIASFPILDPYLRIKISEAIHNLLCRYNGYFKKPPKVAHSGIVLKDGVLLVLFPMFKINSGRVFNSLDLNVTSQHINPYNHKQMSCQHWLDSKRNTLILKRYKLLLGHSRVNTFQGKE